MTAAHQTSACKPTGQRGWHWLDPVVRHPSFDKNGYPTDETLETIKAWPSDQLPALLEYVREAWCDYGCIRDDDRKNTVELVTGGWSGNESILSALMENRIFWAMYWDSSHRGGLVVLRMPPVLDVCYAAGIEYSKSYAARMPNNCAVIERTADGVSVGPCTHYLENGTTCPRHGKVKPHNDKLRHGCPK